MEELQPDATIFSVRIVSIDYNLISPIPDVDIAYSSFQGGKVNEVPVIRIYGSTPGGQKACIHVHGALPYLYVPVSDIPLQGSVEGDAYKNAICLALEKALKLQRSAGSKRQHVHGCDLVRAKRLYGYHLQEELFLKIYLYYPQDVSRAANLLLEGAVLEKSFQPHESHIPFLLQFLVDYNLYGMGLMHLARMKFRLPVPDNLSSGKPDTVSPNCITATADCQIWRESTIPNSWVWQYPSEYGKRQSICQLEADTVVDDIINQQFKMYTSFSQAEADVKMVQSLIPIWQEEHERIGMHGGEMQPDPGKPYPGIVLKTFSDRLDYEQKLLELCSRLDGAVSASTEREGRSIFEDQKENIDGHLLKSFPLLEDSTVRKSEDASASMYASDDGPKVKAEESEMELVDVEDLALLKWFASSQATEDASSADELFQEMILSPLLPVATVNKVMERAHIDYQDESQKECQDILDSIEDFTDFKGLKQNVFSTEGENSYQRLPKQKIPHVDEAGNDKRLAFAAKSSNEKLDIALTRPHGQLSHDIDTDGEYLYQRLPNKKIQQVDGTGDDKRSDFAANSSDENVDVEVTRSHGHLLQDVVSGSKSKQKRKRSLWVPLPLTVAQSKNLDGSFQPAGVTVECRSPLESAITESMTGVIDGIEQRSTSDPASVSACFGLSTHLNSRVLNECSVRDLMRKKRSYRFEQSECTGRRSKSDSSGEKQAFIPRKLEFHTAESEDEVEPIESSNLRHSELHLQTDCSLPRAKKHDIHAGFDCPMAEEQLDDSMTESSFHANSFKDNVSKNVDHKCSYPVVSEHMETAVFVSSVTSPTLIPTSENMEIKKQLEYTFHKKPPTADHVYLQSENALLPIISRYSSLHSDGYKIPVEEVSQDGFLPFFIEGCKEEVEAQIKYTDSEKLPLEMAMGVPLHYQNDGSYLYLLTPAFSAPSVDSVCSWLWSGNAGSEDSAGNHNVKTLPGSNAAYPLKPVLHNSNQENVISSSAGEHPMRNDMLLALQDERTVLKENDKGKFSQDNSQISGISASLKATPLSQIGFRDPANLGAGQQITLFSIEVLAESRGDLRPHPQFDAITVISIAIQHDSSSRLDVHLLLRDINKSHGRYVDGISGIEVKFFSEERDLLDYFVKITCLFDPDILIGWDVQGKSLGFLAERALHLGVNLLNKISRTPLGGKATDLDPEVLEDGHENIVPSGSVIPDAVLLDDPMIEDEWGRKHASGLHVGGRIVLNLWRIMRGEVKLNMYTVEAVAEAVLRKKVPCIHWTVLNKWVSSGPARARYRCIHYMAERAKLNIEIINQLDMINRTSELARVFGIDFFSVLSRGSQYRVESMLLRLAHMQNYIAISPSYQQVASQPAMECLPLVMEPESGFYADPVVVLDFQSLYPSMIIAYNLCFCTCLGKVVPSKADTLGVSKYSADPHIIKDLNKDALVTPNGVIYVPTEVRKGVLPRLLEEILSTRIMIKKAMKNLLSSQKILQRIYNARQLALKLIANVTYGYTAAGFSGRMPCAELADSIVQCGRRTLETAISFVNAHAKWNAKVIYGDTDSMFVLLKGRTWKEAFMIGQEIATEITAINPHPVTLKMEKVYQPCFLLTKKRYVGYNYESLDQAEPVFDAKGIETVRRDTCAAVSKMMEKSLRTYFEQQDISKVKEYVNRQWSRILSGRVSIQDFVFAKEVRLGSYSERASSLPPGAIVAMKSMRVDPRAEPCYGERVPYVVIHGEPGARLVDLVVHPLELLATDSPYRLNDLYYIKKQIIPALQRAFGLVGADLNRWFSEMPRPIRDASNKFLWNLNSHRTRIDYYYYSKHCVLCGELMQAGSHLCTRCLQKEGASASVVIGRTSKLERDIQHLAAICGHCGGGDWLLESRVKCTSLACSVYYERRKVQKELQALSSIASEAEIYPKCNVEWF